MATSLRDYAKQQGLNVGYDELTKKVTLGDKTLAPNQLQALGGQLTGGSWQFGDTSKLNQLTGTSTPTTTPTPVQTTAPMTPTTPDYSSYINSLSEATKARDIAGLQRAYEKSLSELGREQATIKPQYEQGRSQLRAATINQAKDFENWLATQGLSASGTVGQGELQRSQALLGGLAKSQTAEANALADIERRRSGLGSDLAFGIQQAESQAEIDRMNQLIKAQQQADELARTTQSTTEAQAREDFGNTILANYNDLMGFANQLKNQGAEQWKIDQVLAARQQKIAEQGLDQQGRPLPVDNTAAINEMIWNRAMDKWNSGIPLTQEEMKVIGSPYSVKPKAPTSGGSSSARTDDMLTRWKAFGSADPTVAAYFNIPVGSVYGKVNFNTPTQAPSYSVPLPTREDFLANVANRSLTEKSDYIARLILNGTFDALEQSNPDLYAELDRIAENQGVTDASIAQALARLGVSSTSQGVGNTQNIR